LYRVHAASTGVHQLGRKHLIGWEIRVRCSSRRNAVLGCCETVEPNLNDIVDCRSNRSYLNALECVASPNARDS
jgi:hypothetical protein